MKASFEWAVEMAQWDPNKPMTALVEAIQADARRDAFVEAEAVARHYLGSHSQQARFVLGGITDLIDKEPA